MAFDDFDEYEQSEQVRKWLRENGLSIVVGVALALAIIFGWRQWQAHRTSHQILASADYTQMQNALDGNNGAGARAAANALKKDFADTPYASLALAALAAREVEQGKLDDAHNDLQWAHDQARDPSLHALYQVRLARVELAQGKADAALARLGTLPPNAYAALADELRGDAQLKLGHSDAARGAYQAALAALDKDSPQREALQMKLDDLGGAAATAANTHSQDTPSQTGKQGT